MRPDYAEDGKPKAMPPLARHTRPIPIFARIHTLAPTPRSDAARCCGARAKNKPNCLSPGVPRSHSCPFHDAPSYPIRTRPAAHTAAGALTYPALQAPFFVIPFVYHQHTPEEIECARAGHARPRALMQRSSRSRAHANARAHNTHIRQLAASRGRCSTSRARCVCVCERERGGGGGE